MPCDEATRKAGYVMWCTTFDAGNPFVRFDEERSESAELTTAVGSIRPLPLRLLSPLAILSASLVMAVCLSSIWCWMEAVKTRSWSPPLP
jgi:hypothetical protein